ncbi:MAG: hypothetical protein ACRDNJ_04655, partial [Solirubrobacteraceae bacterium]
MSPTERTADPSFNDQQQRLWVTLRENGQAAFLAGGAHTHPGLFRIHEVGQVTSRPCSLHELAEMSPDAAVWLSGYLHGAVPRGPDPEDEHAIREWTEKREVFLRSGAWPGRSNY